MECQAADARARRVMDKLRIQCRDNVSYASGKKREGHLRRKYGITSAQFEEMTARQGGRCAICRGFPTPGRWSSDYRLHVDHDHSTGAIRGLLCYRCNAAIGFVRDDPKIARNVVEYLEKYS
ncbi:MAG: Recombination endonuclease VII [Firmicutes bacterium ADurb.Bin506]|nr:MAG: Recombination endonuclease VII [Firmicutes bacterium ADurb.Bin506]